MSEDIMKEIDREKLKKMFAEEFKDSL